MERTMRLYGNKVYGEEVSKYGLENGYLDYLTLSKIIGPCILNNYLRAETMEDWEIVAGDLGASDIYQDYIISEYGYEFLSEARLRTGSLYFLKLKGE